MKKCECGCNEIIESKSWHKYGTPHYKKGHGMKNKRQAKSWIKKRIKAVTGQKRPNLSKKFRGKGNPMFGRKSWNFGLTKEIDIRIKKLSEDPNRIKKIGKASKGHIVSLKTRKKIGDKLFNRIHKLGLHKKGKNEKKILDNIAKKIGYKIIRQYAINRYVVDGFVPELNIVYEVDELHHFDCYGNLRKKDKSRQNEIENELKCKFIRVKD